MNTYIDAFHNITESVEKTLTVEPSSLELKQSATRLKESIQPCLKELRQSASRLKGLVEVGFDELNHAEDVWNSKPRIAEAPTLEIWQQLGELSGHAFRISRLGSQCKSQAVEKAKKSWANRVERLRKKWFINANKQPKKGIGWSDKEGFIKDIRSELEYQSQGLNLIISHSLSLIAQEINVIQLKSIQNCVTLLDLQTKDNLTNQINLILSEIETKFSKLPEHLPYNTKGCIYIVNYSLNNLVNKVWCDIYCEHVVKLKV